MRASSNITGAECAREILQAAQIHDVDVVETNDFLGDHYDPRDKKLCLSSNVYNTPSVAALGIAAHETGHAIQHAKAYAPLKARMAIVPVTMVASQMLPFVILGGLFFHITGLITIGIYCYAILLVFQVDHAASGIRRLAAGKNHFATNGDRPARRGSGGREQCPQRGCAHVCGGVHRGAWATCSGYCRSATGADRSHYLKMDPALALPARRISDLLSSGLQARAKSKRETMDQPRVDPDQELVTRTQSGDAGAFDELVIKYTPRLYGLVYNMTSNHEDTNDLLQDIFAKAYSAIRGFRGKSSFYTWIHSIAVNMTLNFLKKRGRRFQLSLDDVDASIQNDKEFLESTATSSPVREADLSELQRRLNEAMMKLSEEHRAVVTMFHIQGMPHAEISKILRVSEGTVRSRLFYANRQLQNYLDEFRKNPVS